MEIRIRSQYLIDSAFFQLKTLIRYVGGFCMVLNYERTPTIQVDATRHPIRTCSLCFQPDRVDRSKCRV